MQAATKLASFRRRLAASLIDGIIIIPVTSLILYIWLGQEKFIQTLSNEDLSLMGPEEIIVNYGLPIVLTLFFWQKFAGTPGKLLLGCKVVDAETLQNITLSQGIIRYFAYILSALPLCLGFLWVIWDKKKQGFHDKLAKTLIIRESDDDIFANDDSGNNFTA